MTEKLGNRWIHSNYSSGIYHSRFKNYHDSARDIQIELEADSSGAVYATWRIAGESFEVNEGNGMPGFYAAAETALRDVQRVFQSRVKSNFVLEYLPYVKMREIRDAFGVSLSTASGWTSKKGGPNKKQVMTRRSLNHALTLMGFRFKGRGDGASLFLGSAAWEEEING